MRRIGWAVLVTALGACGGSGSSDPPGTVVSFDLTADLRSPDHFFDFPYPSDLRLTAGGAPELSGVPNPIVSTILEGIRHIAMDRTGFPQMPVGWFHFSAPIAPQDIDTTIAASDASPILLMDLDDGGKLVPTVASTPPMDSYFPENVLAVAPRPGFILTPHHKYAFVVMRTLGDAEGKPLSVPGTLRSLETSMATDAAKLYAPLWSTLEMHGLHAADVAAATVFTTGDVVKDTSDLSTKVLAAYKVDVGSLAVDPNGGSTLDRYCELQGQVTYPQFQQGVPPFDTDGSFTIGADGLPVKTRDETAPITITLPKTPMPAGGYPLVVYFHGTGGVSTAIADRGPWHLETDATKCPDGELDTWNMKTGCNTRGQGPAYVVAEHGIAMAASALPVNPQRYPAGAHKDLPEYFNINNVASLRDIFRQGIVEQRLFIDALKRLTIDPTVVASCTGMSLPAGETSYHFREDPVLTQGQSMGAMYANMISAVEPRVKATVPTGAGGYWSYFILKTTFVDMLPGKLGLLLGIHVPYTFMHPTMALAQTALEPADPMVYMPRLAKNPLPMHPTRSVYQAVGKGDSYFPTTVQDAAALAYGNQEAGDVVWPTMQDTLTLGGLGGLGTYALSQNRMSLAGTPYTGVVVQYEGDGLYDPHAIYSQLDTVKYQYGCFDDTFFRTGVATVPAPAPLGTPCPTK
ncbi:MAG: hypothetical protein ABIP39_14090 [Polyangiaceae bacterium]